MKLFTCVDILKMFLAGVHVRTHMNIRLRLLVDDYVSQVAHLLVDDYVSQVMDMEISN